MKTVANDPFDATDEQIVAHLRKDGRATPRQIANSIAANERDVRDRLKRLEDEKLAHVTLMLDHGWKASPSLPPSASR